MSRVTHISAAERRAIMKRDGFKCYYCGASGPGIHLHIDHVKPCSKGGATYRENMVVSCSACNCSKHDSYHSGRNGWEERIEYLSAKLRQEQEFTRTIIRLIVACYELKLDSQNKFTHSIIDRLIYGRGLSSESLKWFHAHHRRSLETGEIVDYELEPNPFEEDKVE